MSELRECPFCGGEAEVHPSSDYSTHFTGATFFVWCDKCETRGDYYDTEAKAIKAWNTRAERTCHVVRTPMPSYPNMGECSECGWSSDNWTNERFAHCPGCGAKVVDDETL